MLALACGGRTGLSSPVTADAAPPHDAGSDAVVVDSGVDAIEEDVADVQPLDIVIPDGPVPFDCVDAGITYIYVITEQNELFSFYPPTLAFTKIGNIACPSNGATPFSMAVTRTGTAYSVFTDGHLFQLSTANASCKPTSFVADQHNFPTFGMGFAGQLDAGDTLYVANSDVAANESLGTIDTNTFVLSPIGKFDMLVGRCELTGTGDGRLFGLCMPLGGPGSALVQIDPATAHIMTYTHLNTGNSNAAFAYAFWGGDFWLFTSPGGASTVTLFDPVAQTETAVATFGSTIVGAGVSTCAPE